MTEEIPLVPIDQFRIRRANGNPIYWKQGAVGNWELMNSFFGFKSDLSRDPWPPPARLRGGFIANYLRSKPDVNQACPRMFGVTVCVELRRLILSNRDSGRALHTKFDRESLSGLRLEKDSRWEIHHGFGLLWDFCQEFQYHTQRQIDWFRNKGITTSQCRDMIQIWMSLRMLLEALWMRRLQRKFLLERKLLIEGQLQRKLQRPRKLRLRTDYTFEFAETEIAEMKEWVDDITCHGLYKIYEVLSEEFVSNERLLSEIFLEYGALESSTEQQGRGEMRTDGKFFIAACEAYMDQKSYSPDI